jgi:hypothetical protein
MDAPDEPAVSAAVADAWREYLVATQGAGARYAEIEPWAWARLAGRLGEDRPADSLRVGAGGASPAR